MTLEASGCRDTTRSHAILIGVADYVDAEFPAAPAALNSLTGFNSALTHPDLCGWEPDRVTVLSNPHQSGITAQTLRKIARCVQDVLFIYYVGHGKLTPLGQLCLTVADTSADDPDFTGISYDWITLILRESPARVKITILDCCFAGQAIETLNSGNGLADLTHASGVYTLAATARNKPAHIPPLSEQTSRCTSFTGELVDIVTSGIPDGPETLTFADIFPHLQRRLTARGLPCPTQRGTDTAAATYPFTRNAAYQPRFDDADIEANEPSRGQQITVPGAGWSAPFVQPRYLHVMAVAVIVVLLGSIVIHRFSTNGETSGRLDGVSGINVAGDNRPANAPNEEEATHEPPPSEDMAGTSTVQERSAAPPVSTQTTRGPGTPSTTSPTTTQPLGGPVPNVIGVKEEQARNILAARNLSMAVADKVRVDDAKDEGKVVSQNPGEGPTRPADGIVRVAIGVWCLLPANC